MARHKAPHDRLGAVLGWTLGLVLIGGAWSCGAWMGHDVFELSWPVSAALGGVFFVVLVVVVWWVTSA